MAAQYRGGLADNQQCRVIILADLDCFYAQVEQKRCGIPRDVPVAVQQWEGLIAINYAARAKGITRHMRAGEARARCPELQCIHVETIGASEEGGGESGAGDATGHGRLTHKACLERYRKASVEIMTLLRKMTPDAPVEKASIDEVYIDVTGMVEAELQSLGGGTSAAGAGGDAGATAGFGWGGVVIDGPLRTASEFERRLSVGAMIACRLRGAVREQLGYTMSAGIACNKLLAKVAAGLHKPDQQTIVPPRAAEGLLADMPLGKIRNFGGKLGAELQSMGCTTPGQVAKLPLQTLEARFGDRASWIHDAVRGISDEPVQEKELPKSMLAAKSFNATSDWRALQRWLGILAEELAARMADDATAHRRHPKTLVLHYRASGSGATTAAGRSRSGAMPYFGRQRPHADAIAATALKLAQGAADILPCFNLAISATEFASAPVAQHKSIERFFGAAKPAAGQAAGDACPSAAEAGPGGASPRAAEGTAVEQAARDGGGDAAAAQGEQSLRACSNSGAAPQQPQQPQRGSGSGPSSGKRPTIDALFKRAAASEEQGQRQSSGGASAAEQNLTARSSERHRRAQQPPADGAAAASGTDSRPAAQPMQQVQVQSSPTHRNTAAGSPAANGLHADRSRPAAGSPMETSPLSSPFAAAPAEAAPAEPGGAADAGAAAGAGIGNGSGAGSGVQQPSPSAGSGSPTAGPSAQQQRSGSSAGARLSIGGSRRSCTPRRSPTAAAVAARRDAFGIACDAAVAEAQTSARPADVEGPGMPPSLPHRSSASPLMRTCDSDASMPPADSDARGASPHGPSSPGPPAACNSPMHVQQPAERGHSAPGQPPAAAPDSMQAAAGQQLEALLTARPAAAPAGSGGAAAVRLPLDAGVVLDDIDIAEQRRILQDIAVRQRLEAGRSQQGRKRGAGAGTAGTKRGKAVPSGQASLSGFLTKQ